MKSRAKLLFVASFAAAVLIFTIALVVFYSDELRLRVLQPAIESYVIARYYLDFVPQVYLWILPPLAVILVMARRFVRWSRKDHTAHSHKIQSVSPGEGELARLARQIHRAQRSRFARVRLSRTLVEVGARMIAGNEGVSLPRAREILAAGYWQGDGSIHTFLTPRRHYTTHQQGRRFEDSLREAIEYLEEFGQHV